MLQVIDVHCITDGTSDDIMHLRASLIFDGDERTMISFSGAFLLLLLLLLVRRGQCDSTGQSLIYRLSIDLLNDN